MAAARKPVLWLDPRMVVGTPEGVVREKRSYTRRFLKEVLERRPMKAPRARGASREGGSEQHNSQFQQLTCAS